jgi:hypothetical protein
MWHKPFVSLFIQLLLKKVSILILKFPSVESVEILPYLAQCYMCWQLHNQKIYEGNFFPAPEILSVILYTVYYLPTNIAAVSFDSVGNEVGTSGIKGHRKHITSENI